MSQMLEWAEGGQGYKRHGWATNALVCVCVGGNKGTNAIVGGWTRVQMLQWRVTWGSNHLGQDLNKGTNAIVGSGWTGVQIPKGAGDREG